jgi:hypothetical protein
VAGYLPPAAFPRGVRAEENLVAAAMKTTIGSPGRRHDCHPNRANLNRIQEFFQFVSFRMNPIPLVMVFYPVLEPPYRFHRGPRIFERFGTGLFSAVLLGKIGEGKSEFQFDLEEINETLIGLKF